MLGGDPAAFAEIVKRHEEVFCRVILGIVADRHLAEDVLQDVLLICYRRLADFRGESQLGTWLCRVAIREAMRARSRRHQLWQLVVSARDSGVGVSRTARRDAAPPEEGDPLGSEEVLGVLARLPIRERTALVLHVVEERSYVEIAEIMGSPIGTVGSLISRARSRLRRILPERAQPTAGQDAARMRSIPDPSRWALKQR